MHAENYAFSMSEQHLSHSNFHPRKLGRNSVFSSRGSSQDYVEYKENSSSLYYQGFDYPKALPSWANLDNFPQSSPRISNYIDKVRALFLLMPAGEVEARFFAVRLGGLGGSKSDYDFDFVKSACSVLKYVSNDDFSGNILRNLLKVERNSDSAITLSYVYSDVMKAVFDKNLSSLSDVVCCIMRNPGDYCAKALIAYLRYTYSVRSHVDSWSDLCSLAHQKLSDEGYPEPERALKGLV